MELIQYEKMIKQIFKIILLFGIIIKGYSQEKQEIHSIKMDNNIIKKIELETFNNRIGLEMGLAIENLAKERNQNIAVQIERLNHIIFLYVDDNLSTDKHNWLRRKSNVVKNFEESSLSVKNDLINGNMSLDGTFALNPTNYLAKGGAIPIFVKNAGMVAIITVSGLHDEEDHKIIIDALKGKFFE
ncbi:heme-binding protein [Polaribacter sp.]|uniref:heme-binding protein n=1 Tax=Polaribacter sp. TaxID=1920175 RepID=UPI0040483484